MTDRGRSTRGRNLRGLFVGLYLIVQIALPIFGLYLAHRIDAPVAFSWHMFSRVPDEADE